MNTYQNIATLVLRLVGFAMIAIAVSGLTYFAILVAYGRADKIARDRVWGSIIWFVVGSILLASAKPLGKFLGAISTDKPLYKQKGSLLNYLDARRRK